MEEGRRGAARARHIRRRSYESEKLMQPAARGQPMYGLFIVYYFLFPSMESVSQHLRFTVQINVDMPDGS